MTKKKPIVYLLNCNYQQAYNKQNLLLNLLKKVNFFSLINPQDFVGIKVHFGERGNKSYVPPRLLASVARTLLRVKAKPFIFDTNTLYRGDRMNAVDHLRLAAGHGFAHLSIPLIIGDGLKGNDYIEVKENLPNEKIFYLASICRDIDCFLVISHFTLHILAGFGATIKNLGMGLASRRGKLIQHCIIAPFIETKYCIHCGCCFNICPVGAIENNDGDFKVNSDKCIGCAQCISVCPKGAVKIPWAKESRQLQERMVEYAYVAVKDKPAGFVNVCLFMTKECDCMNQEKKPFINDIGILYSQDPVAVDSASLDLVEKNNPGVINKIYPDINYRHQLNYAQKIGLGNTEYILKKVNL